MFNTKRMVAGTAVAMVVLAAPALADGFSFGFSYRSGDGYYYDDCGPTIVYRETPVVVCREVPVVTYRECAPIVYVPPRRVVYTSYEYCGPPVVYRSYYSRGYCAPRPAPRVIHSGYHYRHSRLYCDRPSRVYVGGSIRVHR